MVTLTLPSLSRRTQNAHTRLIDRHARYVTELRGDIVQIVQEHTPHQYNMLTRQKRVDAIVDGIIDLLVGDADAH